MNKHVHFVVPDLFLPKEIATKVCTGLQLPALEKILSCAKVAPLQEASLEDWLCGAFGAAAIAPVTLQADGIEPAVHYWLRADPVTILLANDQLILQPALPVSMEEAAQMCAALNEHFAGDGLHFVAPHPLRWYLRLDDEPQVDTFPLSLVAGKNIRHYLPQGEQGLRWHGVLNEIQMLLHAHPLNQLREQRGVPEINGLWLWGGGRSGGPLQQPAGKLYTDSPLAAAFAATAGIAHEPLPEADDECTATAAGGTLIVWEGLHAALQYDDLAAWRESLLCLEQDCVRPLLQALGSGRIGSLTLDALQENSSMRHTLTRCDLWKFWRRVRPLDSHALV